MKLNFDDLPKVYYFNPKKSNSHDNKYELIEQDQEFRNTCQQRIKTKLNND
jgi:hypothetical protein